MPPSGSPGASVPPAKHYVVLDPVGNCAVIDAKPTDGLKIIGDKDGYASLESANKALKDSKAECKGMGLDVALIYIAFKLNYRAARLYETVDLTQTALTVTRVQPSGKAQVWSFNPYWVRLNLEDRIGRSSELSIASHGKRLVFATFLTDPEREDFAQALSTALSANKAADPA